MDVEQTLKDALAHHQVGRVVDAHRLYKQVLAEHPDEPDALHLLGMLTFASGNAASARDLIRRAITARPHALDFHVNLSRVCRAMKQYDEAEASLRRVIEMTPVALPATLRELAQLLIETQRPGDAIAPLERAVEREPTGESLAQLGELLLVAGRLPEALRRLLAAVQLQPASPAVHAVLGLVLERQGDLDAAVASYRRSLGFDDRSADVRNNLGHVLFRQRDYHAAAMELRRAIELRPAFPQAHNNLGLVYGATGEAEKALASYRRATALAPSFTEAWEGLGRALLDRRDWAAAADAFRRVIALRPSAEAYRNLATAAGAREEMDEALSAAHRATELEPTSAESHFVFGRLLRWAGLLDDAIASFREAMALDPSHHRANSGLLYTLLAHDRVTADEIFAEHVAWGRRHTADIKVLPPFQRDRSPDRRLRIGYVSPNFRSQAIMAFLMPVLQHHDRAAVEVFAYSDVTAPDAITTRVRQSVDRWRRTAAMSDDALAAAIREDQIDVLIELTGHIGDGRLLAVARRPAAVHVSYLGYQETTGVAAVDYVLTDAWTDPPGEAEPHYVEQPWRLPGAFYCYAEPTDAPAVGPLPASIRGHVTFGCLNAVAKATPRAVALWARVLSAVPGSQMVLLATRCRATNDRLRGGFAATGIAPDRVRLIPRAGGREYFERYLHVDVALDPVPFTGHTTTCDAAWMGCPTVTLAGDVYAHRYGGTVMRHVGLGDLVVSNDDAYVRAAAKLAGDRDRLAGIRATLRDAMRASPIMDAAGFTRDLESAYRQMWRERMARFG